MRHLPKKPVILLFVFFLFLTNFSFITKADQLTIHQGTNIIGIPGLTQLAFTNCDLLNYRSSSKQGCLYDNNGYFVYYNPNGNQAGDCDSNFYSASTMQQGLAYYLYANESCSITFTPPTTVQVTLYPGTNIISVPTETTLSDISSICGNANLIFTHYTSSSKPGCKYDDNGYFVYYDASGSSDGDCDSRFKSSSALKPFIGYYLYFNGKNGDGQTPCSFKYENGTISLPPPPSYDLKKNIVIYGGYHNWTDDFDYLASNFDLVDTGENQAKDVAKLKELNPDIVAVFYEDIIAIHEYYPDWDEVNKHEDWFLHDIDGNRIRSTQWNHWYLMNPGSDGWRNHYANKVKDVLDQYPQFDGVFADDCWGTFPPASWDYFLNDDYKIPDYIRDNWSDWVKGMLQVVKSKIGDKLLTINCNRDPLVYIDYVNGRSDEGFAHAPWQSSDKFYSVEDWKADVDVLYQWSGKNKHIMAQGGVEPGATDEEKKSLMNFCLSSYLLGVNGPNAYFAFKPDAYQWEYRYQWLHPTEYNFAEELGSPTNDYYQINSIYTYTRDFEKGKVLVNPSSSSYTITLEETYKTLEGSTVSKINLLAHTGIILLKIE